MEKKLNLVIEAMLTEIAKDSRVTDRACAINILTIALTSELGDDTFWNCNIGFVMADIFKETEQDAEED